jgi:signal transduction histidine kinase/CheY-like chemotaxis protein
MRILSVNIQHEPDVVLARQRARQIAGLLGFEVQDQTRIATAVSEIARNAFVYAGGGTVEFQLEGQTAPQVFIIRVTDQGPGIAALSAILDGAYKSKTGMGLGLIGARRLMDQFAVETRANQGTTVYLKKLLPAKIPVKTARDITRITEELARQRPQDPLLEIQQQNQELLRVLQELRARHEDLLRLNRELEDTNRGVVALYAELDEKADHLRRADELKTRFLSNMSHEFRTPVNSITSLSRLLLDRTDGALTAEQEKQILFIRKAADSLSELINDLLDIAKIEAGKTVLRPGEFAVAELFSTLRGMLRPLLVSDAIDLVFEECEEFPTLFTDESKLSQILRNFLSNALKFTERGEIRVSAVLSADGESVVFSVADTGIGIAAEDQGLIFEEFTQLENPLQKRIKGTGLGLPLCKKLAQLLGGSVSVQSTLGLGSTFSATIPLHYRGTDARLAEVEIHWEPDPDYVPILIVEDDVQTYFLYENFLRGTRFQALPARSVREAQLALLKVRPQAIILDILLLGKDSWTFLTELKANEETRDIPVVVVTSVEDQRKGLALGADTYGIKPIERDWLLQELTRLTGQPQLPLLLIIDDEEISRYVLKQCLKGTTCLVSEAETGLEGLRKAREERPQMIFLDLGMPGMDGYQVLAQLKADPVTRDIPVIINTAKAFSPEEQTQLAGTMVAVLPKSGISRETVATMVNTLLGREASL